MTQVILRSFESNNSEHKAIADEAVKIMHKIVNNDGFYRKILNAQYKSAWFTTDSGRRIRAKPEDIPPIIKQGKEWGSDPDDILDLQIKIKPLKKGTLGVVYPPSPIITTNKSFIDEWVEIEDPVSLAAHWIHEWLHVAGFKHRKRTVYERIRRIVPRNDVPYIIGSIAAVVGRDIYLKENRLTLTDDYYGLSYILASNRQN